MFVYYRSAYLLKRLFRDWFLTDAREPFAAISIAADVAENVIRGANRDRSAISNYRAASARNFATIHCGTTGNGAQDHAPLATGGAISRAPNPAEALCGGPVAFLLGKRWAEGCHNRSQFWRELQGQ